MLAVTIKVRSTLNIRVRVDSLTVKARLSDLVIPISSRLLQPGLNTRLGFLPGLTAPVHVLTHNCPVQFVPLGVVLKPALVCPPLSDDLQLRVPDLQIYSDSSILFLIVDGFQWSYLWWW